MTLFFLEFDLTLGYITKIAAQRSGDLQIQNCMQSYARLLIYAMWPPEAHDFDILGLHHQQCSSNLILPTIAAANEEFSK